MARFVYVGPRGKGPARDEADIRIPGLTAIPTHTGYRCERTHATGPLFTVRRGRHVLDVPDGSLAERILTIQRGINGAVLFRRLPDAPASPGLPIVPDLPNLGAVS